MISNNILINGAFNATGETGKYFLKGFFEISQNNKDEVKLNIGNGKVVEISEMSNYELTPVVGIIKEEVNGISIPIPNVRISFIKDYVVTDKSQLNYNGNRIVLDYDITDDNGEYVVFVPPGIYTIRIDGGKYAEYFTNQVIKNGLQHEFYITIDGLIKSKHEDVIELCDYEEKIITGLIIDQNEKPLLGAEIIISKGKEVITYIKTDNEGKYQFAIKEGVYDIRLRGPKQSVKIIKNYNFNMKSGKGMFVDSPITTGEYF